MSGVETLVTPAEVKRFVETVPHSVAAVVERGLMLTSNVGGNYLVPHRVLAKCHLVADPKGPRQYLYRWLVPGKKRRVSHAYSERTNWNDTWLTPPALVKALGKFDLDPACPDEMPWRTARRMIGKTEDGLAAPWWSGRGKKPRVWLNPPYKRVLPWAKKFADHGSGVILLNGRSIETEAVRTVTERALVMLVPAIRIRFHDAAGVEKGAWFPNLLIGMSAVDRAALEALSTHPKYGGRLYYPNYGRRK